MPLHPCTIGREVWYVPGRFDLEGPHGGRTLMQANAREMTATVAYPHPAGEGEDEELPRLTLSVLDHSGVTHIRTAVAHESFDDPNRRDNGFYIVVPTN